MVGVSGDEGRISSFDFFFFFSFFLFFTRSNKMEGKIRLIVIDWVESNESSHGSSKNYRASMI